MSDTITATADSQDFDSFVSRERERLRAELAQWANQMKVCEKNIATINRHLMAIATYHTTVRGGPNAAVGNKAERAGTRARRGSLRDALMQLIGQYPAGLTRGEIISALGITGNKPGENSVSNALTALKKQNRVRHENKKYLPIETVQQGTLQQAAA